MGIIYFGKHQNFNTILTVIFKLKEEKFAFKTLSVPLKKWYILRNIVYFTSL